MEVIATKGFRKDLRLCPKYIQQKTGDIVAKLEVAESFEKSGVDYVKMEGQKKGENYYRIRVSDWRIGIEYVNPKVIIICILSRGNIYKHFPPQ